MKPTLDVPSRCPLSIGRSRWSVRFQLMQHSGNGFGVQAERSHGVAGGLWVSSQPVLWQWWSLWGVWDLARNQFPIRGLLRWSWVQWLGHPRNRASVIPRRLSFYRSGCLACYWRFLWVAVWQWSAWRCRPCCAIP